METLLISLFLVGALYNFSIAQNKEKVITFIVHPLVQPKDSSIYITGSSPKLGNWDPALTPLVKQKDGSWEIAIPFSEGERLEFKFTKGSWAAEAVGANGAVPQNHSLTVVNDSTFEITIDNWKNDFHPRSLSGIFGKVVYFNNLEGKGIRPRNIIVWLPPNYDINKKKRYPVLYMHDGQNIIDPATSTFGVDWQIDETADSLIKQNKIKEIIIVGIYNTKDRNAEYSYGDMGHAYMDFIVDKLKPFIDSEFRTLPGRNNTAVMGSSMGGLISLELAWEHPEVFSAAGCLSPAFKIQELNYLPFIEKYKGAKKKIKLYIDDGGIGLDAELLPGIKKTIEALNKKGYKTGKDIEWFYDPAAEHNEGAWAKRVWRPLVFMFGK
jgi:predicted alpha/beta superfamily hydrolase